MTGKRGRPVTNINGRDRKSERWYKASHALRTQEADKRERRLAEKNQVSKSQQVGVENSTGVSLEYAVNAGIDVLVDIAYNLIPGVTSAQRFEAAKILAQLPGKAKPLAKPAPIKTSPAEALAALKQQKEALAVSDRNQQEQPLMPVLE